MIERDLVCAVHDGFEVRADLYRPEGPGPHPAVVLVHGGGWQGQSKVRSWEGWGRHLAAHGYAALATSYRLAAPGAPSFRQSLWDVRCAVQYLRGRAEDLDVDPARIGALGDSAGGHLVAMLALSEAEDRLASPYGADPYAQLSSRVEVVVPVYGIFDMIAQWEHDQLKRPADHITQTYLGGTPMDLRESFYLASPLYHASAQNAAGTRWLLVWGTMDTVVDHTRQSEVMIAHLERAGASVRTVPVLGAGHFWLRGIPIGAEIPGNPSAFAAPRVLGFLAEHLGGGRGAGAGG